MSSDVVIRAEGLSKRYAMGPRQAAYRTLRDSLADAVAAPWRWLASPSKAVASETLWALRDVGFEVGAGEVVGIVGRNGAGKSTLLKVLSRITEPSAGRVALRGRVASLLEVGTGFHPELTGRENVLLNGAILGMTRAEMRGKLDAIVDFAGVEGFLDMPVKRYSSGMYVRLAFAVAAHVEPDILLVDEVLAVGDIQFQKKCIGRMESVARDGRTVLFVSHNMGAIATLCTSALWLDHGAALRRGNVAEILALYRQNLAEEPATGGAGSAEMRFLSVRVTSPDEKDGAIGPFSPVRLQATFETRRVLDPAEINLHVEDSQGRQCLHLRTDFDGHQPRFAPGRHEVTLDIESVNLESQIYFFTLRLVGRNPLVVADSESVPVEVRAPWDRHPNTQPIVAVKRSWSWSTPA